MKGYHLVRIRGLVQSRVTLDEALQRAKIGNEAGIA
jgi:hypothetical protein